MNANFKGIQECLLNIGHSFDIIACSETWLYPNSSIPELEGYNCCHQPRKNKRGGGVAFYINNLFNFKTLDNYTTSIDDVLECLTVELIVSTGKNIVLSCIYRQPGSQIDTCIETLNTFFSSVCKRKNVDLCGDFNINLLNTESHKGTRDFMNFLYTLGFYPLINKPSRFALGSATLIDNIFTNDLQTNHFSGLIFNDLSDHLPVFSVKSCSFERQPRSKFINIRKNDEEAIKSFKSALEQTDWTSLLISDDVNVCYDTFINHFTTLYNNHCPVKQIKITKRKLYKPWFTKGLQNACKKKNNLYANYLSCDTPEALQKYKKYKNKLTKVLRFSEKAYFNKILEEQKNNITGTWKILKDIIGKKKNMSSYPETFKHDNKDFNNKKDISNGFNDFFVNVGPNLARKIDVPDNIDVRDYLKDRQVNSLFLKPTTEEEILDIIKKSEDKNSTDSDDLSMLTLKKVFISICTPFTHICNMSLLNGVFPNNMKTAKVVPLFKSGEKDIFTNYRPVSLLSQFSKILEKLVDIRLDSFFDKHKTLVEQQYGFRKARSTSLAIIQLIEDITNANEKKKFTAGVFIDLKKAFDTIDHSLLLKKLEHYGVRGVSNDWMRSYLSNREQYVSFNSFKSDLKSISCGVPQGSILGPKLFILYINDICNVSKILQFVLFADDTNIFCSDVNILDLCKNVSLELDKLNIWFAVNKLSLNVSKTNFIIFGNRKYKGEVDIKINDISIERVYTTKFLGVLIDHQLNWKEHIDYICNKVSRNIAVIFKASNVLNTKSLHSLYCTLILPYLNYCLENWGNTYESNLNKLFLKQKRVIRIINKANFYAHTTLLFKNLNVLKLKDLVLLKTAIFMYKVFNKSLPRNLLERFDIKHENTFYNLRSEHYFKLRFARTTQKQMCLSFCGIKLWNSISEEISKCQTLQLFKSKYKNDLISRY